jgi:hypothetical protein
MEAFATLTTMNGNSAPGQDGFGPSFYMATWPTVKHQVMDLMHVFHQSSVQLEIINRSFMVMLPKKISAITIEAFRLICLQNCCTKIIAKVLIQRLHREICRLIGSNQTGFLSCRDAQFLKPSCVCS